MNIFLDACIYGGRRIQVEEEKMSRKPGALLSFRGSQISLREKLELQV